MLDIRNELNVSDLGRGLERLWASSAAKIDSIERSCPAGEAAPVFTVAGRYHARGWTDWTRGFQYGSAILQFDATGDRSFLQLGRDRTREAMAPHLTHFGVHDHGFNNVSTYGNLRRLAREGRFTPEGWELAFYELALKVSGAVQARRWTRVRDGGFIYSFNGPHSLFADTIRSLRALALAHLLGHVLMDENDERVSLLGRLVEHVRSTARYSVYYGEGRDAFDVRGRVAHESLFDASDGRYRCPGTQQGFSPFSTWTRGLAWILCGCAEQMEFVETLGEQELLPWGGKDALLELLTRAARACGDFYIENTPTDGIPYWDTAAPGLWRLGDYLARPADPFNDHEPVDSSAAAIAAQGLLRLGRCLTLAGEGDPGRRYRQAGLRVVRALLDEPYLSADPDHQGLLLHAIYHRPSGWDHVPAGSRIPRGEACLWGDYHLRELALLVQREIEGGSYPVFFGPIPRERHDEP
jgi:unsaturated chondroitin disaccharide hydrolase